MKKTDQTKQETNKSSIKFIANILELGFRLAAGGLLFIEGLSAKHFMVVAAYFLLTSAVIIGQSMWNSSKTK